MGQTLVRDALHRVSSQLLDIEPQWVTWPERDLVDWLNDGARAIAKFLPTAGARIDAIQLSPGTRQSIRKILAARIKPGDGSAAADTYGIMLLDGVRNMGADGVTPGDAVRLVTRELLDGLNRAWHVTAGSGVIEQITFDPRTPLDFYVQPGVPASPAVWMEVAYCANPQPIPNSGTPGFELYNASGSSAATLPLGDEFVDDLVNYVLARAYMKSPEKAAMAAEAKQSFLASLNAQVKAATGKNPNLTMLPFTPGIAAAEK
jgi:hypothetical protein